MGLVGESGCGKSLTALSIMGLLPDSARVVSGSIRVGEVDLLAADEAVRRDVRGSQVAMVYQEPMTALNPMMRVGTQVRETLIAHHWDGDDATSRMLEVLGEVGMPSPERVARLYPHQLSGGMRQRVLIACALACRPKVLIADEPTTALDVTIQKQILSLIVRLQRDYDLAVLWISHDMAVIANVATRVLVMYAGRIVEEASVEHIFSRPTHPYSAGLLNSIAPLDGPRRDRLTQIPGPAVSPFSLPPGCPFAPRCPQRRPFCDREEPALVDRGGARAACLVPPEEWS